MGIASSLKMLAVVVAGCGVVAGELPAAAPPAPDTAPAATAAANELVVGAVQDAKEPLMRVTFEAGALAKEYPAKIRDANKKLVYEIACPAGTVHEGSVTVSRWKAARWPAEWPAGGMKVSGVAGFFTYDASAKGVVAWHVNFADPEVFGFYGGPLLAQDELQVAEHPLLASVREALLGKKLSTLTVEAGLSTPILVMGVQRRVKVATEPSVARPEGLYGNRFKRADEKTVRDAVTRIERPTISNIVALAAPTCGRGAYTIDELQLILETAYTGFRAAKAESGDKLQVEMHTGFWGCGAFGGNRTVMVALQLAAARLAGIDEIVIHWGDKAGEMDFQSGLEAYEEATKAGNVSAFLKALEKKAYRWGVSDGN